MQILTVANFDKADTKFGASCERTSCSLGLSKGGACVCIYLVLVNVVAHWWEATMVQTPPFSTILL